MNGFCRAACVSVAGLLGLASHRNALQFSIAYERSLNSVRDDNADVEMVLCA